MTKEAKKSENTNKKEVFRGTIKSLHLTTEPCYFFSEHDRLVELERWN